MEQANFWGFEVFWSEFLHVILPTTLGAIILNQTMLGAVPASSEISDLLLFVSYFTSQSKGIKFGVYFFDVCCAN